MTHTITSTDITNQYVQLAVSNAADVGGDGSKSFTAVFTDAAGNTSTTGALAITLDTTAPTGGTPDLIAASDCGTSNTDNITNVTARRSRWRSMQRPRPAIRSSCCWAAALATRRPIRSRRPTSATEMFS